MQKLIPALLLVLLALSSCSKSDDQAKVVADQWYVAYYEVPQAGIVVPQDKTSDFAGYTFEFNNNDEWVIHAPDGSTSTANWGIYDNGATFKAKMLNAVAPVDALLGTWEVVEQTTDGLELKEVPISTSAEPTVKKVFYKKQ